MSHNSNDVGQSANRHRPAIIAIVVVLLAVLVAFLVFRPGLNEQNAGIATTPPPSTAIAPAEGTDGTAPPAVNPPDLPVLDESQVRATPAAPTTVASEAPERAPSPTPAPGTVE